MKLLFDESLSPRLVLLLRDVFPESESAVRDYPTEIAAEVLRHNAIRIAGLASSQDQLIILDQ